jgi:hypothetical protein
MTLAELTDHAANIRELLTIKRHQLEYERLIPRQRAEVEKQIDALQGRVDQLMWQCQLLDPGADASTLKLARVLPGRDPLVRVIPQA